VINAGVNGYGTDQELLFFRREGYRYNPDLVVHSFCTINDVMDNSPKLELRDLADRKQFFVLNQGNLEPHEFAFPDAIPLDQHRSLRQIARSVLNRSKLFRVVRRFLSALTERKSSIPVQANAQTNAQPSLSNKMFTMPVHYNIYAPQYTPEWQEAWEVTKAIILQLHDEANVHGAGLLTVIATTGEELYSEWRHMIPSDWDLDKPNRILSQHLEQNGIAYLPLLPHFRRDFEESGRHLHFRIDGHWTAEGHRLAAEALYNYLTQQDWLP
jgi:hypothetical protein